MGKVVWKENKVISVELRKGLFVLAQMHENPFLIFYDLFSYDDSWDNFDPNNTNILFYTAVTKQFLQNSNITIHKKANYLLDYSPPLYWIKKNITGHRNITFWAGTKNEITISLLGEGGGQLLKKSKQDVEIAMDDIPFTDKEVISSFELTNVRTFPELSERLYLCYKFKQNIDPLKELTFNQEISMDYMIYLRILNGAIDKEEWLSLPVEGMENVSP